VKIVKTLSAAYEKVGFLIKNAVDLLMNLVYCDVKEHSIL